MFSLKSQVSEGRFALQIVTDDEDQYRILERTIQACIDRNCSGSGGITRCAECRFMRPMNDDEAQMYARGTLICEREQYDASGRSGWMKSRHPVSPYGFCNKGERL